LNVQPFIVSHVILKRGRVAQRPFQGRIYESDMVADRFRSRLLRFRSALSHRGRALRYRPVLRTQRSLLLPHPGPERTLGLMGLRVHRFSSLSLPLTRLNPKAPATRADLARTISVRATGSSAQLSQESDQDPNPEHHPGSSRKHFMESLFGFLTDA